MDRSFRISKSVRGLAAVVALVPVFALTACSGQSNSLTSPSPVDNSALAKPPAPANPGTSVVSFSGFNQATLSVTVGTSTTATVGQPYIDDGKIHLSIWVNASGVPVPWVDGAAGTWVRVDQAGGGIPVVTALTSTVVDLDALATTFGPAITANAKCGDTVTFQAQYVTGGGATKVATHFATANFTITCGGSCTTTFGQGYWKNHGDLWPVSSLTLGTTSYTKAQLLSILNEDPGHGPTANGLIILSYQLIAAKLNRANGAPNTNNVDAQIAAANALIGALVVPPVGSGYLAPNAIGTIKDALEAYNQSCSDSD